MDQLTIFMLKLFRAFAFFAAFGCTAVGVLYAFAPDAAHKVNQAINRPLITLDSALGHQPRFIGIILLLIGIPLFYIAAFLL